MLIETELEAKTNLVFKTNGPGLRHLNLAPLRDLAPAWNYTYRTAAGMLVTKAFDYASPRWSLTDKLAAGSGVMVWPSDVGSLLILPLDGITYDLDLRFLPSGAGREQVQLLTHPERLEGGQKVTSRLLIVLHQGTVTSGAALDTLRAASVDVAGCVRALTNGRVMETAYALTVDASENGMTARLDTSGRTEPLPVILRGVTPLWPCGLVQAGTLRLLEAADNTLHFTVSAGQKAVDCFAGNLVRSDRSDLRIEWAGVQDGQVILHLHNPTPQAMTARIWTPPALGLGLFLDASCVVPPGASIWVRGSGKTLVLQNE